MSTEQQVQEIEISMDGLKDLLADYDSLVALQTNKDFNRIINKGYFVDKAAQTVLAKADPNMQEEHKQISCVRTIDSIGELQQYFNSVFVLGERAKRDLETHKASLEEILDEDSGDNL